MPNIADLPLATEVGKLLAKYGYGMTYFGGSGVGLYKKNELTKNGDVPVDCWYFFSKREFAMLYSILQQLEESDRKLNNYIAHLSRIGF